MSYTVSRKRHCLTCYIFDTHQSIFIIFVDNKLILLGRVALGAQRPTVVKLSRERSVGRSVRLSVSPVHCGKTAGRIRMPFGIVGRTGPGMRQAVWFGNWSTGRGTFGDELGARHCPQGPIGRTYATAPRRGPLAKLLWAD